VGCTVGSSDGTWLGLNVGTEGRSGVGFGVGTTVGAVDGAGVGSTVGLAVGAADDGDESSSGSAVLVTAAFVTVIDGISVEVAVWLAVGRAAGLAVGFAVRGSRKPTTLAGVSITTSKSFTVMAKLPVLMAVLMLSVTTATSVAST